MIITESQLREIIQEETIMYRVLNDGRLNESLLDEGEIKDTKESIMNFFRNKLRKPMTSVVALGIALSLGAAANKSYSPEELGEMGFKPDQIAQVEQGVEALGANAEAASGLEIELPADLETELPADLASDVADFIGDWAEEAYAAGEEEGNKFDEMMSTLDAYAEAQGLQPSEFLAKHWSQSLQARKDTGDFTDRDLESLDQIKTQFSFWQNDQEAWKTDGGWRTIEPHIGQTPEKTEKEFGPRGSLPGEKSQRGGLAIPRRFA